MADNSDSMWTDLQPELKDNDDFDKNTLLPLEFEHENGSKCLDNIREKRIKGTSPGISGVFFEFIVELQKIIKDDERRYEIFDNSSKSSLSKTVSYSPDMNTKEIEIALDSMKQMILNSLNRYYDQMRDMDNKTNILKRENADLKQILESKNLELKSLEKKTKKFESNSTFQSLNIDSITKRKLLQMNQLKEDIKTLETESEEFQQERRTLKKELRKYKSKIDDLNDDIKEIEQSKIKLEEQNKLLKNQMKKLKSNESPHSDNEASNEAIESLKGEIKEKDKEICLLKESVKDLKNSLSENEPRNLENVGLIENLESQLKDFKIRSEKDKNDLVSEHRLEIEKSNDMIKKKDDALETIRKRMTDRIDELNSQIATLSERLEQCENEKKKKQEALISSQEKIKSYRSMEDELKKMKNLTWQLNSKEGEVQSLSTELKVVKDKLEEKIKECELIKKEKAGFQEEVNNMKLLNFRNKRPEK